MSLESLRERVCRINRELAEAGLARLTWGNASGIDRETEMVAIKPSGVPYHQLRTQDIVLVPLAAQAKRPHSTLRPSSDTPTHLELYRAFPSLGGIVHTHSRFATVFAQAHREIPCLGTTHADHFYGKVPLARHLSSDEIEAEYEANTGRVIVELFHSTGLNPNEILGPDGFSHPFPQSRCRAAGPVPAGQTFPS